MILNWNMCPNSFCHFKTVRCELSGTSRDWRTSSLNVVLYVILHRSVWGCDLCECREFRQEL